MLTAMGLERVRIASEDNFSVSDMTFEDKASTAWECNLEAFDSMARLPVTAISHGALTKAPPTRKPDKTDFKLRC